MNETRAVDLLHLELHRVRVGRGDLGGDLAARREGLLTGLAFKQHEERIGVAVHDARPPARVGVDEADRALRRQARRAAQVLRWPSGVRRWTSDGLQMALRWPADGTQMACRWRSDGTRIGSRELIRWHSPAASRDPSARWRRRDARWAFGPRRRPKRSRTSRWR